MPEEVLSISTVIPFKDKAKMTLQCVTSLRKYGPRLQEILLVSNNSSDEELSIVRNAISSMDNVRLVEYNHPFNYQKMNNWAVKQTTAKFIFLFNNDTELKKGSVGTIEHMYELAQKPNVGMVGAILLYGDERIIQHAGVYLRSGSLGDHIYVGKPYSLAKKKAGTKEFPYSLNEDREVTAVTGAAQLVERKKFDEVNGFDERFIICGGDVDLCIRLNKAGYQSVLASKGFILHKESQSRSFKPIPYVDFYYSYLSYIQGYDLTKGDPFSPKITEDII